MEEKIELLPLGSVVIVKGNIKKLVVIARGLVTKVAGQMKLFDYGAVLYPEGLLGDEIVYFNHKDIKKIIHNGYSDDDDKQMVENILEWVEKSEIKHGETYEINLQRMEKDRSNEQV